jgi:hypothetical protein
MAALRGKELLRVANGGGVVRAERQTEVTPGRAGRDLRERACRLWLPGYGVDQARAGPSPVALSFGLFIKVNCIRSENASQLAWLERSQPLWPRLLRSVLPFLRRPVRSLATNAGSDMGAQAKVTAMRLKRNGVLVSDHPKGGVSGVTSPMVTSRLAVTPFWSGSPGSMTVRGSRS